MSAERESRLVLEPDPSSARAARRFLRETLTDWGVGHFEETAMLLVSEVVTNVVLHARTPAELVLRLRGECLRAEVHDASPQLPQRKVYGPSATTGRGMGMVGALSSDHGAEQTSTGKLVWFELHPDHDPLGDVSTAVDSFFEADIDDLAALELALHAGGSPTDRAGQPEHEDRDRARQSSAVAR